MIDALAIACLALVAFAYVATLITSQDDPRRLALIAAVTDRADMKREETLDDMLEGIPAERYAEAVTAIQDTMRWHSIAAQEAFGRLLWTVAPLWIVKIAN